MAEKESNRPILKGCSLAQPGSVPTTRAIEVKASQNHPGKRQKSSEQKENTSKLIEVHPNFSLHPINILLGAKTLHHFFAKKAPPSVFPHSARTGGGGGRGSVFSKLSGALIGSPHFLVEKIGMKRAFPISDPWDFFRVFIAMFAPDPMLSQPVCSVKARQRHAKRCGVSTKEKHEDSIHEVSSK